MPSTICNECGNNHYGPCATEETCFIYHLAPGENPTEMYLVGSWSKWQKHQRLTRRMLETNQTVFWTTLTLLVGSYEYKYIMDGVWKHDVTKKAVRSNEYGSLNNVLKVYPKKMFLAVNKEGLIRISSCITISGLKLMGSWDNWSSQILMQRTHNQLKACEQNVAFVPVEVDHEYEFKFKINNQYIIDEKYPTVMNSLMTLNNCIIAFQQDGIHQTKKLDTPSRIRSYKAVAKEFNCRSWVWDRVSKEFSLPYERVEGHSMSCLGEYLYIFGGKCRGEFYNSLTKLNVGRLQVACTEQVMPNGRAFHNVVIYGNKLIFYGGHNKTVLQDYSTFNVSEEKWIVHPRIEGKYPQKKEKQSCVLYEMLLVFFGGYYCSPDFEYETYYSDISVLDIGPLQWIDSIKIEGAPPKGRFAHTACLLGSDMYIFGGICNVADKINLNDIWSINLSKVSELCWNEIKPKSRLPTARHGHTMNLVNRYLIVFGGQDNKGQYLNDVVIFSTLEREWIYPIVEGECPRPRYNHATTVFEDTLIIFGGRTQGQQRNEHFYLLRPAKHAIKQSIDD